MRTQSIPMNLFAMAMAIPMTIRHFAHKAILALIVAFASSSLCSVWAQTASLDVNIEREQVQFTVKGRPQQFRVQI